MTKQHRPTPISWAAGQLGRRDIHLTLQSGSASVKEPLPPLSLPESSRWTGRPPFHLAYNPSSRTWPTWAAAIAARPAHAPCSPPASKFSMYYSALVLVAPPPPPPSVGRVHPASRFGAAAMRASPRRDVRSLLGWFARHWAGFA